MADSSTFVCSVAPPDKSIADLLKAFDERSQLVCVNGTAAHEELCETLSDLVVRAAKPEEQKGIVELKGISVILKAMERHLMIPGVQELGCAALKNLASDSNSECIVVELGGIPAVVRSMTTHPQEAGVQQQACGALWNLGFAQKHKTLIVRLGGLDAVLRAMEQLLQEKAVQEQAFGVLRKIFECEDRRIHSKAVERGVVEAVSRSLGAHLSSPFMVTHGAWLWFHFHWLSNHDANCYRQMMDHGAQDTALQAVGKPFYKMPQPQLDDRAAP